ncbi:DUF421 domain-containing protein [Bacillus sp. NEB1478]|uniref:DUF421 domain-containing protein n=1 Tax=Bacillus sp. NEB1478 TaxID=3073816 RepID=UPI0028735326|nr:DUF421 domain-containing protein [Bacillus sp. NEB1478]WNB91105.1 DUF421 domain-containing protein [Bacillus sp. NEB1478]
MGDITEVIIRCALSFFIIVYIVHQLGKQTISQMTYHHFIASITLGSIAGNFAFNTAVPFINFIVSLLVFSGITFLASLLSLKNRNVRALFNGQPTVIIQDGKILERNLKKLKMTLDSMNQALRGKDIFDVDEVDYAVIEADGQLSVLKKSPFRQAEKKDLGIFTPTKSAFPIELIMDGQLIENNLAQNQLTMEWLDAEIKNRGLTLHQIAYCVRGTNSQLYFDLYEDKISSPIDIES